MKRIVFYTVILSFIAVSQVIAAVPTGSPFRVLWDKQALELKPGEKFEATITIRVPAGHYIYADKTDVDFKSLEGIRIDEIKFPKAGEKEDPYFGKTMEVYTGDVPIVLVGHIPESFGAGERELTAVLNFQGCSPKLCMRPEEYDVVFKINIISPEGEIFKEEAALPTPAPYKAEKGFKNLLKSADFGLILNQGTAVTILIVFLAGILISFTPCIWPIVPVILLIIGVEAQKKWWKNIPLAATLVAGLVLVNAVLGILAVVFGKSLGFLLQERWFLILVVIFFVLMSISMFGLFEFTPLKRFGNYLSRLGGKGFRGALLAGIGLGLIASPCASPVLAALLGYVALKQSYLMGFSLSVVFGLGMGVVFIIIGSAFGMLASRLRGTKWMVRVKYLLGVLLLLPAIFYLRSVVRWNGVFEPARDLKQPRVEWVTSYDKGLRFAQKAGRPIMMEFYADWCPPCRAMEAKFFKRKDIVKLSYSLVPIRVDATVGGVKVEKIIDKYKVMGWPTILFLSPQGKVYKDLTVISYDSHKLLENMRAAIIRAKSGS